MRDGISPSKAALNIVGRINRTTGRREGGLLGLTAKQSEWADNALAQLRSGDPSVMRDYLTRQARDKRFDRTVMKAIKVGKPVSAADAARITNRYRDILLAKRGNAIARTELLGSLHAAQSEGVEQLIDAGKLSRSEISEEWDSSEDNATRETHRNADGQEKGPDGVFNIGGFSMRYPGDSSFGAPAREIVQCRCRVKQKFDFLGRLK
jgi:hypothetical protein